MPQKPDVIVGSTGPLVPLTEDELDAYLRLDTWTLTEALFILNGNRPPGFESTSELISHFMDAYHLAVNSITSGNLCRKITVAGERRFIESPTKWLSWAERKNLHVAEAVRAKMMLAEWVDEKMDAPGSAEDRNDERPGHTPPSDRAVESDEAPELPDTTTSGVNPKVGGKAKRTFLKANIDADYAKWVNEHRTRTGRRPTFKADNEWRKSKDLTYERLRELRSQHRTEKEKEGGRPPRS